MSAALAKIHIAVKELGLEEEDYRNILERLTGKRSAKGLSDAESNAVLADFRRRGWKPKVATHGAAVTPASGRPGKSTDSRTARKTKAMWISLALLGEIRDGSDAALNAFGKRQLGVEFLVWADDQQMYRLIEALKAMARRAGWYQGGSVLALKRGLVACQCRKLKVAQPGSLDRLSEKELNVLAQELGAKIRGAG